MGTSMFIYGFHSVETCLSKQPKQIVRLIVETNKKDARYDRLLGLAKNQGLQVQRLSREELDSLAGEDALHQGIVAEITVPESQLSLEEHLDTLESPFLLVLDGVQDPHNLGACLRTANAVGVDAVIAPKDRATGITPVVVKVASGAVGFTPFFQVTNLARTLKDLKDRGIWLYGASEHAEQIHTEADYTGAVAIVMGSEGKGMRRLTEEQCDFLIRIPMNGLVPSLNVSVATGVCLYEVLRQRSHPKSR